MARDHLQGSGKKKKKRTPPLPTTLPNWFPADCVCVYVYICVYVCTYHWAPGRVAFRLKAAPVKIRIFILYPFSYIGLAARTPALSPQLHGPLSVVGFSSMGLQDPWDEGGAWGTALSDDSYKTAYIIKRTRARLSGGSKHAVASPLHWVPPNTSHDGALRF